MLRSRSVRRRATCGVVVMVLWGLGASSARAEEAGATDQTTVQEAKVVLVVEPTGLFDALARQIETEVEVLLAAEPAEWSVERRATPPPMDDEARITVRLVGPDGLDAGTADLWVDPLGVLDARGSGSTTIRGVSFDDGAARDLALLLALVEAGPAPPAGRPTIVVPLGASSERLRSRIERAASRLDAGLRFVPADSDLRWLDAPAELVADGVYLPPASSVDAGELAVRLLAGGLPSVSGRGRGDVDAGILAAHDRGPGERALARRVALAVLARVRGLPPTVSPSAPREPRPVIHAEIAEALGLELPWTLRLEAVLVGEPGVDVSPTTLEAARAEALDANLDLLARRLATAASEEQLRIALAELRPQIDLTLGGRLIDEETALAAFGAQPERLVTALGEASWLLFSDGARAAVDIERRLQLARTLELEELRLDIALAATAALLEVARADAFATIARDDLELTLTDLDAAESRRAAGASTRADVARLDARAAGARRALVAAAGSLRSAEISFNRLLDRPLDQAVEPRLTRSLLGTSTDAGIEEEADAQTSLAQTSLAQTFRSPRELRALEAALLVQALERAPEIAAAESIVEARRRGFLAARRVIYLPSLRAFASIEERLEEGGAGTEPPMLGPPGAGDAFPEPPDRTWALGLEAMLPLWDGGARGAERTRAALDLEGAEVLREAAAQRVEERLRLALVAVETSFEAARQAARAVDAAVVAFDVVRDAYARGAATLTALLDVQSQLLEARREQVAARVEARLREAELQRAIGRFDAGSTHSTRGTP